MPIINPAPLFASSLLLALVCASGCDRTEELVALPDPLDRVVAKVEEREITLRDFQAEARIYHDLLSDEERINGAAAGMRIRRGLLERLVNDIILEREADRLGIVVGKEDLENEIKALVGEYDKPRLGLAMAESGITFDQWKESLRRRIKIRKLMIVKIDVGVKVAESDMKNYFKAHEEDFRWPERVRALQIMVHDETSAVRIRKKLLAKVDFGDMARKESQSPDAPSGGDLGYFSRGQMPPEFEETVFNLKGGEISDVIKSIYGFHLFKVISKEKPRVMTFAEAKGRIREILITYQREEAYKIWLATLKQGVSVALYPKVLAAVSGS